MVGKQNLFLTLYRYKVHHVLLWVSYFLFWIAFYYDLYGSLKYLLVITSVYFVFNAISYYTTAYYLLPAFLYAKRYGRFFLLFFLLITACSVALGGTLYSLIGSYLPQGFGIMSLMMMGFLSNATIVGILLAVKQAFDRIKSINTQRRQEKERLESELQYLKAQVNPHFLFNSINSIYILIRKDPEQAAETLLKLSDLLRFSLYDCSEEFIPIEKELDYISNFIELEKMRKGKRVSVDFQTNGQLSGFMIAPFLLIPFLENAFKFVSDNGSGSDIKIKISHCNDKLEATFFNTCDNHHRAIPEVGGIGIPNVKRRLELMYPNKHTLTIQPGHDSYSVTLSVDVA